MTTHGIQNHPLHHFITNRRKQNRDIKILIRGKLGGTGLGKTSLGIALAKLYDWSSDGWNYQKATHYSTGPKGTYDCAPEVPGYHELYENVAPRSAVYWMEVGVDAGHRFRSTSNKNKDVADDWQLYRTENLLSIGDLPDTSDVDNRLLRYSDIIIKVIDQGKARASTWREVEHDDGTTSRSIWHFPMFLSWPVMDDDEDYQMVEEMKDEFRRERKTARTQEKNKAHKKGKKEGQNKMRLKTAQRLRQQGMTVTNIAEAVGRSLGWVSENTEPQQPSP